MDESSILVRKANDSGIIRVIGKGSFKNARHVKSFTSQATALGIHSFIFDLEQCSHMDSTFMGTLAGLAIELKKKSAPPPSIYNISPRNLELLQTLGLDRLLKINDQSTDLSTNSFHAINDNLKKADQDDISQNMLEAHEALIEANSENASKFEDVIHFLKNKLDDHSS